MADESESSGTANRLLAAMPRADYRRLAARLESVALTHEQVLFEAEEPLRFVYFLDGGLVSILAPLEGDKVAEVALVGKEGMVGMPVLLGADTHPHRAVVQASGSALRMPAKALRAVVRSSRSLGERLLRYADAFLVQVSHSAVCNCLHPLPKRYCRWLLMAHDRLGSDRLPFTQKLLARLLTVRLASLSETTGVLQRAGLIRYRRGEVLILDRPGLEAAACGCYRRIPGLLRPAFPVIVASRNGTTFRTTMVASRLLISLPELSGDQRSNKRGSSCPPNPRRVRPGRPRNLRSSCSVIPG